MKPIGLHVDQGFTPAPFPDHTQSITFCWACDEFNAESGPTGVVPDSHKLRRPPTSAEMEEARGLVPIIAPAGSLTVWRGETWHSNFERKIPGERAVLHVGIQRLALRPLENYSHLDEAWLQGKPYELRVLLGREDSLDKPGGLGGADPAALLRTLEWARQ